MAERSASEEFMHLLKSFPPGMNCGQAGIICMKFLLENQYRNKPVPNPCPCIA